VLLPVNLMGVVGVLLLAVVPKALVQRRVKVDVL
jgi:hypothetical protein